MQDGYHCQWVFFSRTTAAVGAIPLLYRKTRERLCLPLVLALLYEKELVKNRESTVKVYNYIRYIMT